MAEFVIPAGQSVAARGLGRIFIVSGVVPMQRGASFVVLKTASCWLAMVERIRVPLRGRKEP